MAAPDAKTVMETTRNGRVHLDEAAASRIDRIAAEGAVADLLGALGIDLTDESLRETPRRVADAYAELLTPEPFDFTTFPNDGGYDELVVARGIPFHSLCEHHLLPFTGVAHVGYIPGDRIVGLSSWRAASAWCLRPSTSACRCAESRSQARERSPRPFTAWCATTPAPARSSSRSPMGRAKR